MLICYFQESIAFIRSARFIILSDHFGVSFDQCFLKNASAYSQADSPSFNVLEHCHKPDYESRYSTRFGYVGIDATLTCYAVKCNDHRRTVKHAQKQVDFRS